MNKKVVDCFLHIPTIKSSSYPPIQWMEIKDKNYIDNVLLYIPYTSEFKQTTIKDFTHAVYKCVLTMPDSIDNQIISLIDSIYLNYKDIILVNHSLKKDDQEITFNIDLENTNYSLTQLYFLNKLCLIGNREEIDSSKMVIKINNFAMDKSITEQPPNIILTNV